MIEVELPDGSIAEFPEGTAPDAIKGALQKRFGAPQAQQQAPTQPAIPNLAPSWEGIKQGAGNLVQTADDLVRGAANGLTFGMADRFAGMIGDGTESERAKSAQAQERSPIAYTGGEIGGAVAGMGKIMGAGGTAGRLIPQGMTGGKALIAKMLAGGVDGAVLNEVSNAGYGRDMGENAGLATVVGGAAPALGAGISALGSKALGALNKAPDVMDTAGLKQAAQAAYQRADDAGVVYKPEAMKRIADALKGDFAEMGFDPMLQPKAGAVLSRLSSESGNNVTLKGLDTIRKVAGGAYDPMNKSSNAMTSKVTKAIDDLVANPQADDVLMGDAMAGAAASREAKDLYGRGAKLEKVQRLMEKAGLQAGSTGSGGNIENATRQQLKSLVNNPKNSRGFKPDELDALKKAILGTPTQNALRLAGKLSPQGNGLMMALGGGAAVASPALAIPAMMAGYAAKKGAEGMTAKNIKQLERLIASGGNKSAIAPTKNAAQKAIEAKKDLIAKLLMSGGLATLPAN